MTDSERAHDVLGAPRFGKAFEQSMQSILTKNLGAMACHVVCCSVCCSAGGKNSKQSKADPNRPRRPASAFFIYCSKKRQELKLTHPDLKPGPQTQVRSRENIAPDLGCHTVPQNRPVEIESWKEAQTFHIFAL